MAFPSKRFGNGQLPSTAAALFTAAAGKAALYTLNLCNVSAGSVTVKLWVTIGANHRQFYNASLAAGEFAALEGLLLVDGESLRAECSAATSVDWIAGGAEQTL